VSNLSNENLISQWIKNQDPKIVDKIINNHYKLVVSIANKYNNNKYNKEDLISEGILGIIVAMEKFNLDAKVQFSTYVYFWIKAKILAFIRKYKTIVSGNFANMKKKIYEEDQEAEGENDCKEKIFCSQVSALHVLSLDNIVGGEDNSRTLSEFLAGQYNIEEHYINEEILKSLKLAFLTLNKNEKYIIEKRFLSEEKMKLEDIGKDINYSKENIRQMQIKATKKLKDSIKSQLEKVSGFIQKYFFYNIIYIFKIWK
jgi:RNA polymerase primary sigma factor